MRDVPISLPLPRCAAQAEKMWHISVLIMYVGLKFDIMYVYKATIKGIARPKCVEKLADNSETHSVFLFTACQAVLNPSS